MDSSNLTPEQRRRLQEWATSQLLYLNKLCSRMQRLYFPADDPLNLAAAKAREAMQQLADEARRITPIVTAAVPNRPGAAARPAGE